MTKREYIILQRDSGVRSHAPARAGLATSGASRIDPQLSRVRIEAAELSDHEAETLIDTPGVVDIFPPMPVKGIEPTRVESSDSPHSGAATAWGVGAVGADSSPYDGDGVTVCVLDTGIDPKHPAFTDPDLTITSRNFTTESPDDRNGHGTHCAGTIFGRDVNGVRIGVARGIRNALIGKVLGSGSSTLSLLQALEWATQGGAHVISMSLGIDFVGYLEQLKHGPNARTAISRALNDYRRTINAFDAFFEMLAAKAEFTQRLPLVIAAAGNESDWGASPPSIVGLSPPASASQVLSVGAVGRGPVPGNETVANFSNARPALVGPGVGVISAWPNGGLRRLDGTSMATPHVAGVAALHAQRQLERRSSIDTAELLADVHGNTRATPGAPRDQIGAGLVQAPRLT